MDERTEPDRAHDPEPGAVPSSSMRLTRAGVAGWLSGPGAAPSLLRPDGTPWAYPGERLGLPQEGPGSIATLGRRVVALLIDWAAAILLVRLFFPGLQYGSAQSSFTTLAIFGAEVALFTAVAGCSFGQRLLGLQVVRVDGRGGPGVWRALGRTALLCLAVPPLVWDRDQRGLHDRWMGTVLLRAG